MATPLKAIRTVKTQIAAIETPVQGVRRFVLADEDQWDLPPFKPGAHIDVHLRKGLVRTYSLCNSPGDNRRYVIAVKREGSGRGGSCFMHNELKEGDFVGVSVPRGGLELHDAAMNVFVAGGIGVTPFLSAIEHLERLGKINYILHWSSAGQPCLPDMVERAIAAGRVKLYDTTTGPRPDIERVVDAYGDDAVAFCCGPEGMLDAFEAAVADWPEERRHVERFSPLPVSRDPDARPFTVVLAQSKKEMVVDPAIGLVATLEELDADISVSCGGGVCGSCRTRWLEGPPIHRDRVLKDAERVHEVIICVAGCAGSRLVLDL